MAQNQIGRETYCNELPGDRLELYAYVSMLILLTTVFGWYFNSRTGNPVNGHVFDENQGLRANIQAESVIQLDEIKRGTVGQRFDLDYKKLQVKYDKVKNEWNKENP